jgi:AraC-like DNA-binding protein
MRIFEAGDCFLLAAESCRRLASPGYVGRSTAQDSERMQVACRYILEHFSDEISHRELAARVHLAPVSYCRLFKKVTRKTCTAFINEIRLGHACRLLMESEDSITEIAFACGFRNLSNFNRRFKERYGVSPRAYRQGS